jgi:hypothetical protein
MGAISPNLNVSIIYLSSILSCRADFSDRLSQRFFWAEAVPSMYRRRRSTVPLARRRMHFLVPVTRPNSIARHA